VTGTRRESHRVASQRRRAERAQVALGRGLVGDVQLLEEAREALPRRRHRGEIEDVAEQDHLVALADLPAQRRQPLALPSVVEEPRFAFLIQVQIAGDIQGHGRGTLSAPAAPVKAPLPRLSLSPRAFARGPLGL
jgi:hypothetical protein